MIEKLCPDCSEEMRDGECLWCNQKRRFSEFALQHGLSHYPDPAGERYLYSSAGDGCCKKSEFPKFVDLLWNAMVMAAGGGDDLLV